MKKKEKINFKKSKRFSKGLLSFWKSIIWGIIIIFLSLLSGNNVQKISFINFPYADKVVHFFMYFLFSYFLFEGFTRQFKEKLLVKTQIIYVLLISIIFGITMEILQITIAVNRSGEILDFISNLMGSVIAIILFSRIQQLIARLKMLVVKK